MYIESLGLELVGLKSPNNIQILLRHNVLSSPLVQVTASAV